MSAFIQFVISGIAIGCAFALLGSGFVTVFRVTRVVNFAQGTFPVLAGFIAYAALSQLALPHGVSELLGVLGGSLAGLVFGVLAIGKPGIRPIASLVITLGLGIAGYAVEIVLWGPQPESYDGLSGSLAVGGVSLQYQYVLLIGVTLAAFAGLWLFFTRTYLGKGLAACSSNTYAARVVGIDVRRMGVAAFTIGGTLGGAAGVLLVPIEAVTFNSDVSLAISGFAAAICGGLLDFPLALAGGIALGVAESLVAGYAEASYESVVALSVMIAFMSWRALRQRERGDVEDAPSTTQSASLAAIPASIRMVALVVVAVVTFLLPLKLSSAAETTYVETGLYVLIAAGLSLFIGYAGQVSAGQAAFMAIGAYTAAVLSLHGVPSALAFGAGPVLAALTAVVIGVPILRMRANYLAFATIAFQLIVLAIVSNSAFLGGSLGLFNIPALGVGNHDIVTLRGYAWLTWLAVVVVLILSRNIIESRPGRALRALATSEVGAEATGVHVGRYKLTVFAIAAAYAGLAGAIYAFFLTTLTPDAFPVALSIEFLLMVIIGGLGTISGAVIGAVAISLLLQWLNNLGTHPGLPAYMPAVLSYAAYGVLLVGAVLVLPNGVAPALGDAVGRAYRRLPHVAGPLGRRSRAVRSAGMESDPATVGGLCSDSSERAR